MFFSFKRKKGDGALTAVVFGEDGVALARVVRHGDQPARLLSCAFQPWGNDHARTLRELIDTQHAGKTRCTTLMNPMDYQMMLVDALQVPADEMRNAIRWRIKDLLDFPVDEAIVDVFGIPDQNQNQQQVYAVAARATQVNERIETIKKAGLQLSSIDIEEMALRNLMAMTEEDAHGVALLYLTGSYGLILITLGGELYLSRRIDIGSDTLFSAAEEGDPDNGVIGTRLEGLIDQVTLEVQRSLDYYVSNFTHSPVTCVMLAPTVPDLPFLAHQLGGALAVPVRSLDLASLFTVDTLPEPEQQAQCLMAIGAALRAEAVEP